MHYKAKAIAIAHYTVVIYVFLVCDTSILDQYGYEVFHRIPKSLDFYFVFVYNMGETIPLMTNSIGDLAPDQADVSDARTVQGSHTFAFLSLPKEQYGFLWFAFKLAVYWSELTDFNRCTIFFVHIVS